MRDGNRPSGGLPSPSLSSRRPLASRAIIPAIIPALLAVSQQSVEICDDRAFATTRAHEAIEPVDQRPDPIGKPRQERNVHDKP